MSLDFSDTGIAFKNKTDNELKKAIWLFKSFNYPFLVQQGPLLAAWAIRWHIPMVRRIIRNTIFSQFCGGENIEECEATIQSLSKGNVKSILDYSVEGAETEQSFDATRDEILRTIAAAKNHPGQIAFSVFKCTGIARFALLEKINPACSVLLREGRPFEPRLLKEDLNAQEFSEMGKAYQRFAAICGMAVASGVRLLVDAEETWIQDTIDLWTEQMMREHNKSTAYIYCTTQMYRHDRVFYLKRLADLAMKEGFLAGVKIVRGAYMEKERARAAEKNYASPIQPDKESADRDFDDAVYFCLTSPRMFICVGTHNEQSCLKLTRWMEEKNIAHNDQRIWFSQLLGMSDNLSFNLAASGYNVAKYVPYGPVLAVLPYLSRRAMENSSVKGQVGRELALIHKELKRRHAQ
jgi:proline dehydrogenase